MANSVIEICNSALTKIGAESIVSLDDQSKTAIACKERYESNKRAVLRMHSWNCAIGRSNTLSNLNNPPFGFTYAYELPSDCLRVLDVNEGDTDYKVEGRQLLTDETTVELKYIKDVSDAAEFDELLAELIAMRLAWDICYKITQSSTLKTQLWEDFNKARPGAKTADAQEEPSQELEANYFLESRLAGVDSQVPKRNWPA